MDKNKLDCGELDSGDVDGGEVEGDKVEKKVQKTSKSKKFSKSKKMIRSSHFLTSRAKLAFTKLRQAFFKFLILHYFNLDRHIRIKIDVLDYAIGGVFSQLTLDNLSRWHPVAFFSQNMIPAKTWYKTHDDELLDIVEAFKT